MKLKFILFLFSALVFSAAKAQTSDFMAIFFPLSENEEQLMKTSAQKTVISYNTDPTGIAEGEDTMMYINWVRKFSKSGKLIEFNDYMMGNSRRYTYDEKDRLVEYYEQSNESQQCIMHFTITYTKKGKIEEINNVCNNPEGKIISFNKATKTITTSVTAGYLTNYTIDDNNRLVKVVCTYNMITPYTAELTYDAKGRLMLEAGKREGTEGMADFETTYTYTSKGFSASVTDKEKPFLSDEYITITKNYIYNEKGEMKAIQTTGPRETEEAWYYDTKNRPILMQYFEDGYIGFSQYFVYR